MNYVAYYRVSTRKQGASGLGLEAQQAAVLSRLSSAPIAEFTEVESGRNDDRAQLRAALDYATLTGSTLIVAKLDRLSRDAAFLNQLLKGDVPIVFADMPFADRFMIGIMAQVAQWEAEQISKRTREALSAAKARGQKLGGNRGNVAIAGALGRSVSAERRKAASASRASMVMPFIDSAREAGCKSYRDIAAYLNERHIKTARGGEWYAASVRRVVGH